MLTAAEASTELFDLYVCYKSACQIDQEQLFLHANHLVRNQSQTQCRRAAYHYIKKLDAFKCYFSPAALDLLFLQHNALEVQLFCFFFLKYDKLN
jgi:hypothetical protein